MITPPLLAGYAFSAESAPYQSQLERLSLTVSGQPLAIWSRRPDKPLGIVVLVHGRTWSARTAFDFEPRAGSRSLLQSLATAGFATYAVDLRGYGESPRDTTGWLAPHRAVEDVEAVLGFAAKRHPELPAPMLLGWSRGSKIAALAATRANQRLSGLVLYGFTFDPAAPPLNGPAKGKAPGIANTAESAKSDFVSPGVASPELIQDFVDKALAIDPTRVDVCCDEEFLAIRPEAIRIPTLLIQGARDPDIKPDVAATFFSRLANDDRRWIIVGRGDHAAHLETTAPEITTAIVQFARASMWNPQDPLSRVKR
jgi:pimeloyl-ACP methyl ester carboxylesterase